MGCSDCGSKGGCDARKGTQREVLDEVLARVYPAAAGAARTWGVLDDEARFRAGVSRAEGRRLARSIASLSRAPAFFCEGEPEDLCDFVYVLCVGRQPSLFELREGLVDRIEGLVPGARVEEKYLRVALSSVGRIATTQEVTLSLALDGDDGHARSLGPTEIVEAARPGVFDPVLLKRVRKGVALLEASDVAHIDFGLLDRPLEGALPGAYVERYGVEPRLVSFLFQAAPPETRRIVTLALDAAPAADLSAW